LVISLGVVEANGAIIEKEKIMNRVMRLPEVEHVTGLKRSSIYRLIKEGRFPVQIKLGARSVAWKSEEIQERIDNRPRVKE